MPRNNEIKEKTSLAPIVIPAIVGAISTIAAAYFSYSAGVNAIQIPLNATQTVEARQSPTVQIATSEEQTTPEIVSTPTIVNSREIQIEQIPSRVFASYSSDISQEERDRNTNQLELVTGLNNGITYRHVYSFSENAPGAALYFKFSSEINLSDYQAVAFTINKNPEILIKFYFADKDNNIKSVNLSSNYYGAETGIKEDKGNFYIPLKYFDNMSAIQWLYFWIDASNTKSSGKIEYEVSNIRFIK